MAPSAEKILEARIAALERQVRELSRLAGMQDEDLLRMEYEDAMDQAARGNVEPLKAHLRKVNAKRAAERGHLCSA